MPNSQQTSRPAKSKIKRKEVLFHLVAKKCLKITDKQAKKKLRKIQKILPRPCCQPGSWPSLPGRCCIQKSESSPTHHPWCIVIIISNHRDPDHNFNDEDEMLFYPETVPNSSSFVAFSFNSWSSVSNIWASCSFLAIVTIICVVFFMIIGIRRSHF